MSGARGTCFDYGTGAFYDPGTRNGHITTTLGSTWYLDDIGFRASRCDSAYSGTAGAQIVRPTSIGCSMWKRTA